MFSKETFTSYIQNQIGDNANTGLMAFVEKFPFNSNAQLLLTKVFFEQKNIGFNEQLKSASLYAIDRKFLFKYIHTSFDKEAEQNPVIVDTPKEIETVVITPIEKEKEEITLTEQATNDSLLELADAIHEVTLNESPVATIEKEELEAIVLPKTEQVIEATIELEQVIMSNIKPIDINQPQSFLSWLHQSQYTLSTAPSAELPNTIDFTTHSKDESSTNEESSESEWPLGEPPAIDKKAKNKKIVDKFILEQPRIKPVKAEFYNPSEKAKKSVEEDEDLVSETLVLIYAKQGNYRKAIKALEKLSLKFPEKSAYFASQIEKIKDYLVKNNVK